MGKPRLEDINERTLVKLRDGELGAVMIAVGDYKAVYTKLELMHEDGGCCRGEVGYEKPNCCKGSEVVAVKDMSSQAEVIAAVAQGNEPDSWDWQEADDKFKVGDWFEVIDGGNPSFAVGERHPIKIIDADGDLRDERGYCISRYRVKPCPPPAPVVLTPAQIAEIKARYGNGGDVQISMDGKTVAL